jgi:tripartite-type tricarboxylate transporter receptor subunit TctC
MQSTCFPPASAGDLRVTHVPYRGGGLLLQNLVAGNIDVAAVTFAAGAEQARAGRLVPLVVTSAKRTQSFPNVPTASESVASGFVQ